MQDKSAKYREEGRGSDSPLARAYKSSTPRGPIY
jgi:hypothetical protein